MFGNPGAGHHGEPRAHDGRGGVNAGGTAGLKKAAARTRHAASFDWTIDQARFTFAVSVFGLSPVSEAFT